MVNDLLDFSRGRLGRPMPLTRGSADLGSLVREIVAEVQSANPRSAVFFNSTGDLTGSWDVERIKQAVANLLLNAIQYGTASTVTVKAEGSENAVSLEVHNEGLPITPALLPTIFDPLVRGYDSGQNDAGLGLGLFIVSEIVSAHGGTINVTSSEAAGTSFVVHLPRRST
jgi:signal transduction histidine kinase